MNQWKCCTRIFPHCKLSSSYLFSLCDSLTSQTLTKDSLTEILSSTLPPGPSLRFQPLLLSTFMLTSMQCLGRYLPNKLIRALFHESWWFFTYPGFLPETGTICELGINDCGRQNPTMTFNIWEANNRKLVIAHFSHVSYLASMLPMMSHIS